MRWVHQEARDAPDHRYVVIICYGNRISRLEASRSSDIELVIVPARPDSLW